MKMKITALKETITKFISVLDPKTPVRRSRSKSVDAVRIQEQNDTRANNNETECIIIDDNDDENDIGKSAKELLSEMLITKSY